MGDAESDPVLVAESGWDHEVVWVARFAPAIGWWWWCLERHSLRRERDRDGRQRREQQDGGARAANGEQASLPGGGHVLYRRVSGGLACNRDAGNQDWGAEEKKQKHWSRTATAQPEQQEGDCAGADGNQRALLGGGHAIGGCGSGREACDREAGQERQRQSREDPPSRRWRVEVKPVARVQPEPGERPGPDRDRQRRTGQANALRGEDQDRSRVGGDHENDQAGELPAVGEIGAELLPVPRLDRHGGDQRQHDHVAANPYRSRQQTVAQRPKEPAHEQRRQREQQ